MVKGGTIEIYLANLDIFKWEYLFNKANSTLNKRVELSEEEGLDLESKLEEVYYKQIVELRIPHSEDIKMISCGYNGLTKLDVSHLPNLRQLNCHDNELEELILNEGLRHLHGHNNKLKKLDLPNSIYTVKLEGNSFEVLNTPSTIRELRVDKDTKGLGNLINSNARINLI